jgi:hypothetical protein
MGRDYLSTVQSAVAVQKTGTHVQGPYAGHPATLEQKLSKVTANSINSLIQADIIGTRGSVICTTYEYYLCQY